MPYGEVGWVRNARAAAEVEISRAARSETLRIEEVAPEQADSPAAAAGRTTGHLLDCPRSRFREQCERLTTFALRLCSGRISTAPAETRHTPAFAPARLDCRDSYEG